MRKYSRSTCTESFGPTGLCLYPKSTEKQDCCGRGKCFIYLMYISRFCIARCMKEWSAMIVIAWAHTVLFFLCDLMCLCLFIPGHLLWSTRLLYRVLKDTRGSCSFQVDQAGLDNNLLQYIKITIEVVLSKFDCVCCISLRYEECFDLLPENRAE